MSGRSSDDLLYGFLAIAVMAAIDDLRWTDEEIRLRMMRDLGYPRYREKKNMTNRLDELIPGNDPALLRYYALLALTTGEETGRREVHDAWSAWKVGDGWTYGPDKDNDAKITPYLVPFEDISEEIAAYDDPYVEAIKKVAAERAAA